jgi:DNA repair ATPase RecN
MKKKWLPGGELSRIMLLAVKANFGTISLVCQPLIFDEIDN